MSILTKLDPRPVEIEYRLILTTAQLNTVLLSLNFTKESIIGSQEYNTNSKGLLDILTDALDEIEDA